MKACWSLSNLEQTLVIKRPRPSLGSLTPAILCEKTLPHSKLLCIVYMSWGRCNPDINNIRHQIMACFMMQIHCCSPLSSTTSSRVQTFQDRVQGRHINSGHCHPSHPLFKKIHNRQFDIDLELADMRCIWALAAQEHRQGTEERNTWMKFLSQPKSYSRCTMLHSCDQCPCSCCLDAATKFIMRYERWNSPLNPETQL